MRTDHEFADVLKQCAARARAMQSDHMGEAAKHRPCEWCEELDELILTCDGVADALRDGWPETTKGLSHDAADAVKETK